MVFCNILKKDLDQAHLLKHPFYQQWNEGKLTRDQLQVYAKEYYHHVSAFPRYISQIHALCSDIKVRQVLLENLVDEEQGEENHPELWLRFAEGIGVSRGTMGIVPELHKTKQLVDGYFDLVKKNFATGLGALYAYERQTPAVSDSKISGLKQHYGVTEPKTLQFFEVHKKADEWHTEELEGIIDALPEKDLHNVRRGAKTGAELLWGFLDGMLANTTKRCDMASAC